MQKIVLNVIPDGVCPKVYVNQFDIGRQFQIKFKEDSITYDAPNGLTFKINGRKADNHVFEYTESDKYDATHYVITKSGSGTSLTIIISTTEQMTAAAGDAEVQLTLKDSANRVIGTLNFILAVQERPASVGDPSESDLPDIVRSVNGITPDADGDVQLGATGTAAIGAANISTVENTRIMQSAHAAGSYVYVAADDQLYHLVSTIGAGGTLTPGTNALSTTITSDLADKTSYLSNSSTATTLETEITPGQNYAVPNDGYYLLCCYNTADNTRSANFSLNGTNVLRNSKSLGLYALVPLKKGAVLTTRANTSGSNDDFHYTVASSFIP